MTGRMDPSRFPNLSGPIIWGPVTNRFVPYISYDEHLVSNVTMVPSVGGLYAMMRLADGRWEMPGGTLEPGEHWRDALRREMMEELGAELVDAAVIGWFRCTSAADRPYRPHIPHPEFVRLVTTGEVRLVGHPTNPEGAEQVERVELVDAEEAYRRFRSIGRPELGELHLYADLVRHS